MARGNQRELARQKNLKKQQADGKGRKDDGQVLKIIEIPFLMSWIFWQDFTQKVWKLQNLFKSLTPAQRNERDAKALAEKKAKKAAQKAAAEGGKK